MNKNIEHLNLWLHKLSRGGNKIKKKGKKYILVDTILDKNIGVVEQPEEIDEIGILSILEKSLKLKNSKEI